jgi:hypothetical protein
VTAQELQKQNDDDDYDRSEGYENNQVRIDRYLNVEVWTDHDDGEYYEGDRVSIYFRASRDAFVAVYSIDTKGRVNMLFPNSPSQDNYVVGGVTQSLPGRYDDYDLVVSGPEGVENVQIIASREPFPLPDWYQNSGMFCDWENRHDYMDWVNGQFFVKYGGQRFAYDRTAIYVYEWEPAYFRPVYRPYYPAWTVYGNAYVDYWYGSSIYIDGLYWGCAPLYLPRLYVGWHTFTVYDRYGHCWERDVHVTRYNTVVLDYNVIVTRPDNRSKFKEVRFAGYQEPVKAGYKDYEKKVKVMTQSGAWKVETDSKVKLDNREIEKNRTTYVADRKFVRGSSKIVTTDRGIETAGADIDRGGNKRITSDENDDRGTTSMDRTRNSDGSTGSIFKRRDSEVSNSDRNNGGKTQKKTSDVVRKSNKSDGGQRDDNGSSGSYKKSPSNPVKKEAPAKATVKQSDNQQQSNPPQKSTGTVKSSGSSKGSDANPKQGGTSPKKSSGSDRKKGGRN